MTVIIDQSPDGSLILIGSSNGRSRGDAGRVSASRVLPTANAGVVWCKGQMLVLGARVRLFACNSPATERKNRQTICGVRNRLGPVNSFISAVDSGPSCHSEQNRIQKIRFNMFLSPLKQEHILSPLKQESAIFCVLH